mgnify:CR=1 FL=1
MSDLKTKLFGKDTGILGITSLIIMFSLLIIGAGMYVLVLFATLVLSIINITEPSSWFLILLVLLHIALFIFLSSREGRP